MAILFAVQPLGLHSQHLAIKAVALDQFRMRTTLKHSTSV
jgi:hypothetical protein